MGKRPRTVPSVPAATLQNMATKRVTKSGIEHILTVLYNDGLLNAQVNRHEIGRAVACHASVDTPHGPVIQHLDVDADMKIECCHPSALLHYLCTISDSFADMCKQTVINAGDAPLRYVAYNDGVVPGNPFRPEKGRKVESWYWVIVDWPTYILHRSGMWPVFTLIRTRVVERIHGGVSHVSRRMLHTVVCGLQSKTRASCFYPGPSGTYRIRTMMI